MKTYEKQIKYNNYSSINVQFSQVAE